MDHSQASWIKMSVFQKLALTLTLLFPYSGIYTFAQELSTDLNRSGLDWNASQATQPARTTKAQTINKAAFDLVRGEEGVRVGAAKLLGKYPGNESSFVLVGALDDQSALVRRAIVVSLAEHASNGFPLFDRSMVEKVFSRIADIDVEVRREVSAMIPRLVSGLLRAKMETVEINGRKIYRSVPSTLRPDLYALTLKALLDEDAIVRQNLLKYHRYLRVSMPVLTFEKLLNDSDQGVLLAAMAMISSYAREPSIIRRLEELAKHSNRGIRLKVVDVARDCNRYDSRYRSILRLVTQDSDPEVSSMAAVELARLGEKLPPAVLERIKDYLINARGMNAQVTTILYAVSAMGEDGMVIYRALTDHTSSKMRTVAWQKLLSLSSGWKQPSLWLEALKDKDKGVRDTVLRNVRGRVGELNPSEMNLLVTSAYPNVRIFAGQCLMTASVESVEDFGFELLIDEDEVVRSTTIRALGVRKLPGWLMIMSRSLLDDNYVVQRAAMDSLLSDREKGIPTLKEHLKKNPSSKIGALARNELQRMGVSFSE